MRTIVSVGSLGLVTALLLVGCADSPSTSAPASNIAEPEAICGDSLAELVQSAQREGSLTVIATPDDWANYRTVIDGFEADYDIPVTVVEPYASSREELDFIKATQGQPGRPDVIDIGPSFISDALSRDLVSSYEPTTWSQIPDALKDAEGRWIGTYFGLITLGANSALVEEVPQSWQDLEDPKYKNQVVMNGDPRSSGTGFAAVVAAALANGGSYDDITPGIEYFGRLAQSGNLRIETITPEKVLSGDIPIMLDWAFNLTNLQRKLKEQGSELAIQVPRDGIYGSYYAQSIIKNPENPCAARLWIEHLLGDSAAIARLNGLAIPARFATIDAYGLVPQVIQDILPSSNDVYTLEFPTADQLASMSKQLDEKWDATVASRLK